MADTKPNDPISTAGNTTAPNFTFEEQVLTFYGMYNLFKIIAYSSLYTMALICIIWGTFRSLTFVRNQISKSELIETSITTKEAKRFPITASLVLFGLYLVFKTNDGGVGFLIEKSRPFLPIPVIEKAEFVAENYIKPYFPNKTAENSTVTTPSLVPRILDKVSGYHPWLEKGVTTAKPYIPELTKTNLVYFLLIVLCWEGCVALATIFKSFFSFFLSRLPVGDRWPRRNIPYLFCWKQGKKEMKEGQLEKAGKKESENIFYFEYDTHFAIAFFFCSFVGISHIYQRHWITNDLLAIAFSIYGIENLHLASFKSGVILLSGLFIYDIFWVFATDVMTTVAKSIDAPILLMFPQDLLRNGFINSTKHGMLGLGDIVIPGIFIALLYRFDNYIGSGKKAGGKKRYYFYITVFAYALGLLITMGAAQPALLYLVPTCVLIPLLGAAIQGEFKQLWNYSEEHLVDKGNDNSKSTKPIKETKEEKKDKKNK